MTPKPLATRTQAATALITGATSGIGLALARQLAAKGYGLVLIARDRVVLDRLSGELARHGAPVHAWEFDLIRPESAAAVAARLKDQHIAIDLLVNNAGVGVHGDFAVTDLGAELNLVRLQLDTLLALTKAVLPGMLARGGGRILNIGSVYSFSPVPFQAVYSACKAFMLSFSLALDNEVRSRGVTVTTSCPGITRTAFRQRSGKPDKGKGMSSEAVAAQSLAAALAGRRVVVPGVANAIFVAVARHLPMGFVPQIMRIINTVRGLIKKP